MAKEGTVLYDGQVEVLRTQPSDKNPGQILAWGKALDKELKADIFMTASKAPFTQELIPGNVCRVVCVASKASPSGYNAQIRTSQLTADMF